MNEQIKKTQELLKQFWGSTSGRLKKFIVIGAIAVVAAALVFSVLLNSKEYVMIFDDLSESEASEILTVLQGMDVSVKIENQDSILVPAESEAEVRMALATQGYPKSGLSYYLIKENSGMLTTDYEKKQYVNMQLQERIAASIGTLEGVKQAVVTITPPSEKVFYLQETEEPTASVVIHMKDGYALSNSQISGIQNLVAKSVTGLTKNNIALVDSQGNNLVGGALSDNPDFLKVSLTREIESDIRKKIYGVLQGPYDISKVKVSVTAVVDTDNNIREELIYSPSIDGDNTGVISKESESSEMSTSTDGTGGVPGTDSNAEVTTYPTQTGGGESSYQSTDAETEYKVSEVKSQTEKSGAVIESITIGIAIDKPAFDPGERESIVELVAYAAGVEPANVTVQNFAFEKEEEGTGTTPTETTILGLKGNMLYLAAGAALLLLIIAGLVVFLLLKKKKKKGQQEVPEMEEEVYYSEETGEYIPREREAAVPITAVTDSRSEAIKDFAKENPEIVAQMIKSWLRSESD